MKPECVCFEQSNGEERAEAVGMSIANAWAMTMNEAHLCPQSAAYVVAKAIGYICRLHVAALTDEVLSPEEEARRSDKMLLEVMGIVRGVNDQISQAPTYPLDRVHH